jgi:hypothetical protein
LRKENSQLAKFSQKKKICYPRFHRPIFFQIRKRKRRKKKSSKVQRSNPGTDTEFVVQLVVRTRISLSAKKETKKKKKKGKTRQDKTRQDFPLDELETEENRGTGAFT